MTTGDVNLVRPGRTDADGRGRTLYLAPAERSVALWEFRLRVTTKEVKLTEPERRERGQRVTS